LSWGIIFAIASIALIWLYFKVVSPRPEFPPLETDPDDPMLLAAMAKARESIEDFKSLYKKYPDDAFVKLYFVSNTDNVEHLAAHVEEMKDDELRVLLVTPPVTHNGHLDRVYTCTFDDIEDWQVTDVAGNIYGGFTQRAMFDIARREGVELPEDLQKMEEKYIES
jgi:uncharacterized protein YegJ (DUF2314 family)